MEFPKVKRPIRMGDYTEEFGEKLIEVWVNVPRAVVEQIRTLDAMSEEELFAWLSGVWGAGLSADDPEAWPVENVRVLYELCRENDPALWRWLLGRTLGEIIDYRLGVKKN